MSLGWLGDWGMPISKSTNLWSVVTVTYRGNRTKAWSGAEADVTILVGFIPHNGRQPHPVYCELLVHRTLYFDATQVCPEFTPGGEVIF